jgi:hypothetical protein
MTVLERAKELFGELVIGIEGEAALTDGAIDICVDNFVSNADGIVILFSNGRRVRFRTSEWAWIESADDITLP